jgi:uncharacterized protein
VDAGDRWHAVAARRLLQLVERAERLVTTNHVIAESYTLIRVRLGHTAAQDFLRRVRASGRTERIYVPESWEGEAEAILAQFADQDFSYVDAVSFATMRRLRLGTAFAFDHHFVIAGFALLADS